MGLKKLVKKAGKVVRDSTKAIAQLPKGVLKDPSRLLTGVDPVSTGIWNEALGTDKAPLTNLFGGPTGAQLDAVGAGSGARLGFKAADTIAGAFGGSGIANGLSAAGNSIGGAAGSAISGAGNAVSAVSGGSGGGMDSNLWGPVIGAVGSIGGAALSKTKGAKDPNAYLAPYLQQGAGAAADMFQSGGPKLWEGSTVAGPGDATRQALGAQIARGQNGSPLIDQAQGFVQQGLQQPISSMFGDAQNPYAQSVGGGTAFNPYARSVGGGAQGNPYATTANPFGEGQNPGLDAAFDHMAQKTMSSTASEFARAGRNIGASAPVRSDILSNLAAQIYAPAYESERNRELQYGQQQLGIGATGFENAQSRNQNAALQGQQIGAGSFDAAQGRNLSANLNAQNIGAQGFESAQGRQLSDIQSQRQNQLGMLGFATPLAAQDYLDLQQQRDAGSVYDQYGQAQLSDQVNQFNQQQNAPGANLDALLSRLGMLKNSTGPAMPPTQQPNYLAAGIGGALAGRELFGSSPKTAPAANDDLMRGQAMGLWG